VLLSLSRSVSSEHGGLELDFLLKLHIQYVPMQDLLQGLLNYQT